MGRTCIACGARVLDFQEEACPHRPVTQEARHAQANERLISGLARAFWRNLDGIRDRAAPMIPSERMEPRK